ncbi:hypothetical protein C477_13885 [Haloterrigena salina JCM 13891]|uniref:DUF58 domain-containing protein n=1 Tax=Haloterrigena salina JCM 13891 TaxID=1227488 RepID=M0C215_9EURY|nr:DUF58 domain-containing protein [Haloterrigena salina]ELZ17326.1 hypothetical protein C477_13885 [Haloterrigena salina JCM 13891]
MTDGDEDGRSADDRRPTDGRGERADGGETAGLDTGTRSEPGSDADAGGQIDAETEPATAAETGSSTGVDTEPDDDLPEGADGETADAAESVVVDSSVRETNRWAGVAAVASVFGGAGVVVTSPALLLAAVVGIAYAAYARAGRPPAPTLSIDRELEDGDLEPGESVRVTVRVRNDGDELLPDLRVVDGVPAELAVTDGSPRHGTALRPGETETFSYAVTARQGTHAFEPIAVVARGFTGDAERVQRIRVDAELRCPPAEAETDLPLRSLTLPLTGRVETDVGGEGLEFHSTREYRRGDPLSRIDWNRRARGQELTTVTFREERSATVILAVDTRTDAYRRPDETGRHAVDRSIEAAVAALDALDAGGNNVGLASFGPHPQWLAPGSGADHRASARRLLATDSAFDLSPPESSTSMLYVQQKRFRSRMPPDSQVILFTPLCDDDVVRTAQLLEADGHLVTVVSPDPTGGETPGERLGAVERAVRISTLRGAGIRVVDWPADDSLAATLERSRRRWSA